MGYRAKWKYIETKFDSRCADCGSPLPAGTRVKWYWNSRKVYGIDCHTKEESRRVQTTYEAGDMSPGSVASHHDPTGVYAADGQKMGSTCGCEDYPCCGH